MAKKSPAASQKISKPRAPEARPTYEQVAKRAYEIYLERGATPGDPMQDWLRAELELSAPAKKPRFKSKVIPFAA